VCYRPAGDGSVLGSYCRCLIQRLRVPPDAGDYGCAPPRTPQFHYGVRRCATMLKTVSLTAWTDVRTVASFKLRVLSSQDANLYRTMITYNDCSEDIHSCRLLTANFSAYRDDFDIIAAKRASFYYDAATKFRQVL